jgi:hypothetical protein
VSSVCKILRWVVAVVLVIAGLLTVVVVMAFFAPQTLLLKHRCPVRCRAMQDIKHPENGLGFTFFREAQSNESTEAHISKDAGGSVGISVSFSDRFQARSFVTTSGGRDMSPEGFSQAV